MSVKSEGEYSDSAMGEDGTNSRRSSTGRSWSSSLTRSRKGNSRIATVKPVAKCLSSSEEELSKAFAGKGSPRKDLGSTSPRIARLLSKDVAGMEKDAIVAEIEKCLTELESEDSSYKPLVEEYNRIEEERDELANELENAFEELEGYMQHVKDVEADKKSMELEKEELAKEVENLKFVLTNRQQIKEISLRKDKECLESKLKDLSEENKNMKEQINELLEERQSLIESLLNLHSAEVDDVIQTRSRSCSTVSMESVASSALRNECSELRERVLEAEEAEVKLTDELMHCRGLLKEAVEEKGSLEDENEALSEEYMVLEKENTRLKDELDRLANQKKEGIASKSEEQIDGKISANEANLFEKIKTLEDKVSYLEKELCSARDESTKQANRATENSKKLEEYRKKREEEKQLLAEEISQLENKLKLSENKENMLIEAENNLKQSALDVYNLEKDKKSLEKQMAEIGEKLLNERAKGKQEKIRLEEEVEKVRVVLDANQDELKKLRNIQAEKTKVDNELCDVRKDRDELKERLDKVTEDIKKTKENFANERRKFEKEILDLNTKNRSNSEAREGLSDVKNELERTKKDYAKVLREKNDIENELSSLKSEFEKEKGLFINEKDDLEKFIQHLETRIENLKTVQEDLTKSDAEVEHLRSCLDSKEEEKRELEKSFEEEISRYSDEKTELQNQLKAARDEVKEYKEKSSGVSLREAKLKENEFKVRKLEQTLSDAMKDKVDTKREVEKRLKHEVDVFRIEQDKLHEEIQDLRSKLKNQAIEKQTVDGLNSALEYEKGKMATLEAENRDIKKQCTDFESLVTSLRKDKTAAQSEAVKIKSEKMKFKADLDKANQRLRTTLDDLGQVMKEKDDLAAEIIALKSNSHKERNGSVKAFVDVDVMQQSYKSSSGEYCESCAELRTELDHVNEEKSEIIEDLERIQREVDNSRLTEAKLRASIDGMSKEISVVSRENNGLKIRLDGAKTENANMSEKLRKSTEFTTGLNTTVTKLKEENKALLDRVTTLEENLAKAHEETKSTVDRTRSMEENNANMLRSLKARKNELQMELTKTQHDKEVLEKEAGILRDQVKSLHTTESRAKDAAAMEAEVKELREKLHEADEQTRAANLKAAETELQNRECTRKLHESEKLILDLQRAVARANDVAMEKALESSRNKRLLEKKFEKVLKENANLRKQFFFDGPTMIEVDKNRARSISDFDVRSPPANGGINDKRHEIHADELRFMNRNHQPASESPTKNRRKQSVDELQTTVVQNKDVTLSRSGSAPLSKRLSVTNQQHKVVKTTVTARSVTPPVKYYSDTDSVGSKPESNDGDSAQAPAPARKPAPPSYYETKRNEKERQSLPQPERVHRPILLKEIPFPNISPANQRRSRPTSPNVKQIKANNGKERMEHWV